jgi:hypothetical protein
LGLGKDDLDAQCSGDFSNGRCSAVAQCVTGCCIFSTGTEWSYNYNVQKDTCENAYLNHFFDASIASERACAEYFENTEFPIYFNVVNEDGTQLSLSQDESYIQKVGETERCTLDEVPGNSNYNYIPLCNDRGEVGFGSYFISAISEDGGVRRSYAEESSTIYVNEEKVYEIVLSPVAPEEEVTVSGTVYSYRVADDGSLQETTNAVEGATITISGANVQIQTDSAGEFSIQVPKDAITRTISVIARGFSPWGNVTDILDKNYALDIYLVPETTVSGSGNQICCPSIFGCAEGITPGATCFAGQGQYGNLCAGSTPEIACKVGSAPYCCQSPVLCPEDNRVDGAGCYGQGCTSPCAPATQCLADDDISGKQIRGACQCGGGFYDTGYCCPSGVGAAIHSDVPCSDLGMPVTGLVLGKGRSDARYVPKQGVIVYFNSDQGNIYRTETKSDGTFVAVLPEGTYTSNVVARGYDTPDQSHQFIIRKVDEFTHSVQSLDPFKGSESRRDDVSLVINAINISKTSNLDFEIPSYLDEDFDHIYVMSVDVPRCDWITNPQATISIQKAEAKSILGTKAVQLEWEFNDCLELSYFKIMKKATLYENGRRIQVGVEGESDDEFYEIAQVPASQRTFVDEEVEWSHSVATFRGTPIVSNLGGNAPMTQTLNDVVEWKYDYTIQPVFANRGNGKTYTNISITMGDQVCEGMNEFTQEFCAFNVHSDVGTKLGKLLNTDFGAQEIAGLRTLRVRCAENNSVVWTSFPGTDTVDCRASSRFDPMFVGDASQQIYVSPTCYGPDTSGQTSCRVRSQCGIYDRNGNNPFGMMEAPLNLETDDGNRCYGEKQGDKYQQSCVLQPYSSTSDKCMYCEEIVDCTDYTSQQSCEIDNCLVGNFNEALQKSCRWISTTLSSAGEGICVPAEILPSESFCSEASRTNAPFDVNIGWSVELCQQLGNCYVTDGTGCKDCRKIQGLCSNYDSEDACIGNLGNANNLTLAYPKPEDFALGVDDPEWQAVANSCGNLAAEKDYDVYYQTSNDGCELNVCAWDPVANAGNGACIRDANGNTDTSDDDFIPNVLDHYPPQLSPVTRELLFSHAEGRNEITLQSREPLLVTDLSFQENRFGFRYCIDAEDQCCPHLPSAVGDDLGYNPVILGTFDDKVEIDVVHQSAIQKDGLYYLRYIAQDENLNVAPLESIPIIIDRTLPKYEIELKDDSYDEPEMSHLTFKLASTGNDPVTGAQELVSCRFDLRPVNAAGFVEAEKTQAPEEGEMLENHRIEYIVEDGFYNFYVECTDAAGNVNGSLSTPFMRVRADQNDDLAIVSPLDGGAVNTFTNVLFSVETLEVPSACSVSWPLTSGREVVDLETSDGYTHELYTTLTSEGPVFDEYYDNEYEFRCIESVSFCTQDRTECTTNADCEEGTCEFTDVSQQITFAVDTLPPETSVSVEGHDPVLDVVEDITTERRNDLRGRSPEGYLYDGIYYHNGNVSLTLSCEDQIIDPLFPTLYAGCDDNRIKYCTVPLSSGESDDDVCTPSQYYDGVIEEESSFALCYYATDNVENEEEVHCQSFYIDRKAPVISFEILTDLFSGRDYYVADDFSDFIATISDGSIATTSYTIRYIVSSGRDQVILDFNADRDTTPRLQPNGFTTSYVEDDTLQFTGTLPEFSQARNGYGPNLLEITARDIYGNPRTKTVRVFFDTAAPVVKEYSINNKKMSEEAIYSEKTNFKFFLDDVFWTHDVQNVRANVYSVQTSYLGTAYEMGEITLEPTEIIEIEQEEQDAPLLLSEEILEYIEELFYQGTELSQRTAEGFLTNLGEWKSYEFSITPAINPSTQMYDMGVGEYVLEIFAEDKFDQVLEERIFFNVTDPTPPQIRLMKPETRKVGDDGKSDERTRLTNNVNQVFEVFTDEPAYCYFNLGNEPTRDNLMSPDDARQTHTFVLTDFEPFDRVTLAFVVSCTEHGNDLTAEQYTMIFDRQPLALDLDIDKGERTSLDLVQSHIIEHSLDYGMRLYGGLRPNFIINETNAKRISCRYECQSPNAICPSDEGEFSSTEKFYLDEKRNFNFEQIKDTERYAFGDYLYAITCQDQSGNEARTKDLAISIRSNAAPQKLAIMDANAESLMPQDGEILYTDNVTFSVATNMMTFCEIDFADNRETIPVSDVASLSHTAQVVLEPGTYTYKYVCELSADRSKRVESDEQTFIIRQGVSEFSESMITQVRSDLEYLPLFTMNIDDPDIISVQYALNEPDFTTYKASYNLNALHVPLAKASDNLYIRGVGRSGEFTNVLNVSVHSETVNPSNSVSVDILRTGSIDGAVTDPVVDSQGRNLYFVQDRDIFPTLRFSGDDDGVEIYLNGNRIRPSVPLIKNGETSYLLGFDIHTFGTKDVYVLIKEENGPGKYVMLNLLRSNENPEILSVTPRFIKADKTIKVVLSKPAFCHVVYPTGEKGSQTVKQSLAFGTEHIFVLDNLRLPLRRHEASLVSVSCRDKYDSSTEYSHLVQIDSVRPDIVDIHSDNAIRTATNNGYTFTTVRDEDAHIIVDMDEFSRCTYTKDGVEQRFADYFLPNLHPHVGLPTQQPATYDVTCEDEAGQKMLTSVPITVRQDLDHPLYIHDIYPSGTTNERRPELEVYTFRDASCTADVFDPGTNQNIFFRILNAFTTTNTMDKELVGHRYRHSIELSTSLDQVLGLEPGVVYKARVSCTPSGEYVGQIDGATAEVSFMYSADSDPRPNIYIE